MGVFYFKRFAVDDCGCGMKICSDSVLLAAWFLPGMDAAQVLDVGAGSGLISLLAADILPQANVTGIEIDPAAAQTARVNFVKSPWGSRLKLVEGSFDDYHPALAPDLIISNPPYFSNGAMSGDSGRAVARHQGALTYEALIEYAAGILSDDGGLGFVSPCDGDCHAEAKLIFRAEMAGLKLRRLCRVATSPRRSPTRLLWHFSRRDGACEVCRFDMRCDDGSYTDGYRSLVGPYYQKL